MTHKILSVIGALFFTTAMYADPIIPLTPIFNPDTSQGDHPRSPVLMPEFYLDGYTLTAGSYTVGSTVELLDADGVVVFTSYVYIERDTIVIPSTLSGTYTIRVTRDDTTFVGEIEL